MKYILLIFITLSAIGLFLSAIVHVTALLGSAPFGELSWGLHGGIFIVWFPAVIAMMANYKSKIFTLDWKEAFILNPFKHRFFKGCPKWMVILTTGLFIYGIINFLVFMALETGSGNENSETAQILRGFSGHWMIFYSAALSILYSVLSQRQNKGKNIDKLTVNKALQRTSGQRGFSKLGIARHIPGYFKAVAESPARPCAITLKGKNIL